MPRVKGWGFLVSGFGCTTNKLDIETRVIELTVLVAPTLEACLGFRVQGSGMRVYDLGFGVWGLELRV